MSKQTINIGASPNDGTGTPLRTSFDYTNQNFTELYTALGGGVGLPGATTQVIFNDGGTNLAGDAGLVYNKTTDTLTAGNATITGAATVGTTLGVTGVSTFAAGTALLPALTTTGDTNTGIYYPAADTFAVTTGGTERYRVNSTGLGIGVSPSNNLHVKGASGDTLIRIEAITDGLLGFIGSASGVISGSPANNLAIRAENGLYLSGNGNATQFILNSAGNVTVSLGNVVMGTSGKGIDFSAVTGGTGTVTANVLNDYEEGTFTPTVTSVGGTGIVYVASGSDSGRYTKIGRVITFQVRLAGTYTGTFSYIRVALPFTANASTPDSVVSGYNNSTGGALTGRSDAGSAYFIVSNIQPSGDTAMYSGFITS